MERQRSNSAPAVLREKGEEEENAESEAEEASGLEPSAKKSAKRNITVLCRFRPENAEEVANGGENCVEFSPDNKSVTIRLDGRADSASTAQFFFSHIFQSYATQMDMHAFVGEPVVEAFFSGVNCSVLAYGQTGSGKTFTMLGEIDPRSGNVVAHEGLIPRMFTNILRRMQEKEDTHFFTLTLNFVEIYMEKLLDLLWRPPPGEDTDRPGTASPQGRRVGGWGDEDRKLIIHSNPDGTLTVVNCTEVEVQSLPQAMSVVQRGLQRRTTAATKSNKQSSRSHAVLIATLVSKEKESKITRNAQLYLVDLAGSEKVAKTEAEGMRLDEAKMINQSLFSLGQVVTALSAKRKKGLSFHIPYRDSKLTRLLENSLGGNALTFLVVTCSPNSYNDQETLSTLRFGAKAQLILTKPVKNTFRTVEELEFLLEKARQEIELQRSTISMLKNQVKSVTAASRTVVGAKLGKGAALMNNLLEDRFTHVVSAVARCPITGALMRDPVVALDGYTYERRNILDHLRREDNNCSSPMTGQRINQSIVVPNLLLKSLLELVREAGIVVQDGESAALAPSCPFLVFDVLGVIMSFIALPHRLPFARVNTVFARVVYDRSVWADAIAELLAKETPERRKTLAAVQLPAHKVFLTLHHAGEYGDLAGHTLDALQFRSSNRTLYSSGLRETKR